MLDVERGGAFVEGSVVCDLIVCSAAEFPTVIEGLGKGVLEAEVEAMRHTVVVSGDQRMVVGVSVEI